MLHSPKDLVLENQGAAEWASASEHMSWVADPTYERALRAPFSHTPHPTTTAPGPTGSAERPPPGPGRLTLPPGRARAVYGAASSGRQTAWRWLLSPKVNALTVQAFVTGAFFGCLCGPSFFRRTVDANLSQASAAGGGARFCVVQGECHSA